MTRCTSSFAVFLVATFFASGLVASCSRAPASLDVATTTSVQNSGLLEALLPRYPEAAVWVHAAGSGRALAMLSDGIVDLAISHAPETEARFLADHPAGVPKTAYNRFVLVGPREDPAHVRETQNVIDAFRRIVTARAIFVSRGESDRNGRREAAGLQRRFVFEGWHDTGIRPALTNQAARFR